uniref:Predicted protein putative n=1 Tax=Albugo laibachii Nc14 TaxID=890382 RepID=F0WHX3_9STRA|nr:predicted protein putative [Albugo laibachii Nc14]|eukprot:CCA20849.1 predicted protein putative [Albugo laibachii Nc14]
MVYSYVATAQKSTSVTHAFTAHFTSPTDLNLLIAKCTHFEVHLLTAEGLQPQHDIKMYGRIAIFEKFRPSGETQDWIFLVTQRFQFCVLAYDTTLQQIITKANGSLRDTIGRNSEILTNGNIDPDGRLIGMNIYEGYFKVIPIDNHSKSLKAAFNIRLDELRILDIKFLYGYNKPTICVLYEDFKAARHVKTYFILLKEKDFAEGPWSQSNVEAGANLLIPVPMPYGGVLIISNQTIVYHNGTYFHAIPMQNTMIQVYGAVGDDGSRFLLADQYGALHVVALQTEGKEVLDVYLEVLGQTSIASCVSYLDNGVVFVGSTFGDSQLVKLNSKRDESGSYIEVLDSYVNIGPIIDFCVMDLDRQGQGQIVTCSGADKDGSLRVIRNGIGINEQASAELPGIKGMWALRESLASEYDKYLVQSYLNEIRIMTIGDSDEMEEVEIEAFLDAKTLYCRNVNEDGWLQVTETEVRIIDAQTTSICCGWIPPPSTRITVASANPTQIVLATSSKVLIYMEILDKQLMEKARKEMEFEIACIDLSPRLDQIDPPALTRSSQVMDEAMEDAIVSRDANALRTSICAVGFWTSSSVCVLSLPSLDELSKETFDKDLLPRSVLCASFEDSDYLLIGLGDGSLVTCHLDREFGTLSERKRISLGTQPISLSAFWSKDKLHVFASCDRPTVIYYNKKKLLYSNVNAKEVAVMSTFHSEVFPECLALASGSELTIGTVDDIQKLHIQSFHLNEWARRIAHDSRSRTLGVATVKLSKDDGGDEVEQGYIRLFDDQTFECLKSFRLDPFESPCSIITCIFTGDSSGGTYYVVGTAFVHEEEAEPHQGRILVFTVSGIHGDRRLQLVTEKEVKGSVYCLNAFNGKLLAGVNSKVYLFKWSESEENGEELVSECGHHGHTLVLYMESRGDFIVVGDLMKSISLLNHKQLDGSIEEIARDLNSNWMTAVGIIDDDNYVGSETDFNLFTVQRNSGAASDEERGRLETIGEYHLGEFVNRFRYGSLVMQHNLSIGAEAPGISLSDDRPESLSPLSVQRSMLFGTVSGMIGVILPISKEKHEFLMRVQSALNQVIQGVGGFSHSEWRTFENRRSSIEAHNFIDGDLIESFLDLSKDEMKQVVDELNRDQLEGKTTLEALAARIEELSQMH